MSGLLLGGGGTEVLVFAAESAMALATLESALGPPADVADR